MCFTWQPCTLLNYLLLDDFQTEGACSACVGSHLVGDVRSNGCSKLAGEWKRVAADWRRTITNNPVAGCQAILHAARLEEENRCSPWEKHDDRKHPFYVLQATNTIQWAPPKDVYYLLPRLLEEQLQRCFSLSEIATLKVNYIAESSSNHKPLSFPLLQTYFAEVDFDEDGFISKHQLLAVLEAMQFHCDGFVVRVVVWSVRLGWCLPCDRNDHPSFAQTGHILPMLRHKGHTSFDFKLVCWISCVLRLFLSDDGSKFHVLAQPQLWPYLRSDLIKHVAKRKVDRMLTSMYSTVEPPFYTPSDNAYPHGRVCLCGCRAHLVPRHFETS